MPNKTHLNALSLAKQVRDRLVNFAVDSHYTRDPELTRICDEIWRGPAEQGGLIGDLWVEGAFPARPSDDSLGVLASQGLFDGDLAEVLDKSNAVPRDRRLYTHQREAIVEAAKNSEGDGDRPAMIITAGTGAGKTECFLLRFFVRICGWN